jgi:sugar lactone lactonase YvrE
MKTNRYLESGVAQPAVAPGWSIDRLLAPCKLYGANGMRFGADGRLYVAQAFGSQISALDPASGAITTVCATGSEIVAPDDIAFDSRGVMYATEVFSERVSARMPDGTVRVIADQLPVVNGISVHADRIFVDEFRVGGRVMELYLDGRAPRVIAADLMLPNALALGPDDYLYFPLVVSNEIWRVPVAGGAPERFVDGLSVPTAVKFAPDGSLVVVQAGTGDVTRINLQTRDKTTITRSTPGLDNLAFSPDGALFVSHYTDGSVTEISRDGAQRVVVEAGLVGPFGLATSADGKLYIADGMAYAIRSPDGTVSVPSNLLLHGFPGYVRGVALGADGTLFFTNSAGGVATYVPGEEARYLVNDLSQAMGIIAIPGGEVVVCEAGAGRVIAIKLDGSTRTLATGLARPVGIARAADGSYYVSESAAGRVVHVDNGNVSVVLSGLREPQGVAVSNDTLYVVDRAAKTLHHVSLATRASTVIARDLPVGAAPGIVPKPLPGIPGVMPGPLLPFADIALDADGAVLVGADGDGSILRLRPDQRH